MNTRIEKRETNTSKPAWDVEVFDEANQCWVWDSRFDFKREAIAYLKARYEAEVMAEEVASVSKGRK